MLLYDRVYEAAVKHHRRVGENRFTEHERMVAGSLHAASVYDITNVVPLLGDWERDRYKPIPKRPPHSRTWCEWTDTERYGTSENVWKIGVIITEQCVGELNNREVIASLQSRQKWSFQPADDDLLYAVTGFKMLLSSKPGPGIPPLAIPLNAVGFAAAQNLFCLRPDGSYVGCSWIFHHKGAAHLSVFGLNVVGWGGDDAFDSHITFWPPFMAFALLHCKNVATEAHAVPEQIQRRVRKAGNPPRVSWKTINIRVPETKGSGGPRQPGESDANVRFHLCRGHFKNLTHPRFKNPGLHWWPAHWRGDPDAGVVITDRQLQPQ